MLGACDIESHPAGKDHWPGQGEQEHCRDYLWHSLPNLAGIWILHWRHFCSGSSRLHRSCAVEVLQVPGPSPCSAVQFYILLACLRATQPLMENDHAVCGQAPYNRWHVAHLWTVLINPESHWTVHLDPESHWTVQLSPEPHWTVFLNTEPHWPVHLSPEPHRTVFLNAESYWTVHLWSEYLWSVAL